MKAYALDLRERVVKFLQAGGSKVEAARRFDLARRTVYRYLAAAKAGRLAPKTSWGKWRTWILKNFRRTLKSMPDDKILLVDEALEQLKLGDPEKAKLVTLKFFAGLTNEQVAEILGLNEYTVRRQWEFAKVWLFNRIRGQL